MVTYLALLCRPWLYQTECLQSWQDVTFTLIDRGNEVVFPMLAKGKYTIEVILDGASNTMITSAKTSSTFDEANLYCTTEENMNMNNSQEYGPNYYGELP